MQHDYDNQLSITSKLVISCIAAIDNTSPFHVYDYGDYCLGISGSNYWHYGSGELRPSCNAMVWRGGWCDENDGFLFLLEGLLKVCFMVVLA